MEKIEKVVMVVMIAGVCYILYKEYSLHGTGFVDTVVGGNAEDITFGKAIDMVAIYIYWRIREWRPIITETARKLQGQ